MDARVDARADARESARKDACECVRAALAPITTTPSECAEDARRAPGAPCASRQVARAIMAFVVATPEAPAAPAAPAATSGGQGSPQPAAGRPGPPLPAAASPEAEAVRAAAEKLGCNSESCVLTHPSFRSFAVGSGLLKERAIDLDLALRFKAEGPRNTTALLSDFNIDSTLQRWARVFTEFYPCPFAMMDFDRTQEPFATIDLVRVLEGRVPLNLGPGVGVVERPAQCFGCVVNTDTSAGPGKHWVAVFVDCRPGPGAPWTVEYFNSAGRPPPREMARWMERSVARLAAHRRGLAGCERGPCEAIPVAVTDRDHQKSQTECGLYALYYIRRRLEGHPYTVFFRETIPDAAMVAFRAHVFRAA